MTKVYYFSGAGHSLAVAKYISDKLQSEIYNINTCGDMNRTCRTAVVVFPVYCQNIPDNVINFLKSLKSDFIAFAITYGGISYGNVLSEAKAIACGITVAGALIPTGHSYLNGGKTFDKEQLSLFIERLENPESIQIPERRKNIFADFFPEWRSRVSVKIKGSSECTSCNICGDNCPVNAIKSGIIGSACIRCMKCVTDCPNKALSFKNSLILNAYLKKKRSKKQIELFL